MLYDWKLYLCFRRYMHGRKYGLQYENKNGAEFRLETRYEGIEMAEA